jgi:hypothetical protein
MNVLRAWLVDLTDQVGCRLRRHRLRGRTVQLIMAGGRILALTGVAWPGELIVDHERGGVVIGCFSGSNEA